MSGIVCRVFVFLLPLALVCAGAEELDEDVWKVLSKFRRRAVPEKELAELRSQLFQVPEWEARVAAALHRLAVKAKQGVDAGLTERERQEADKLFEKLEQGDLKPEEEDSYERLIHKNSAGARKQHQGADAIAEASRIIYSLAYVADPRVVPLIIPILYNDTPGIAFQDSGIIPLHCFAAEALWILNQRGAPFMKDSSVERPHDVDAWKEWWSTNRSKFPGVGKATLLPGASRAAASAHGSSDGTGH